MEDSETEKHRLFHHHNIYRMIVKFEAMAIDGDLSKAQGRTVDERTM